MSFTGCINVSFWCKLELAQHYLETIAFIASTLACLNLTKTYFYATSVLDTEVILSDLLHDKKAIVGASKISTLLLLIM